MKILVTGGAGFIGSHLCEALINLNEHEVYSLDNYFTGSEKNHISGVTYIRGDTKDIFSLIEFKPDLIYHLGEYSRVETSFDDAYKVFSNNMTGTYNVLEFAKTHNSKIVYAGSSTKFGDVGKDSSPYAWSKATNTELVQNYGKWFNIKYAITYFYNVYGSREIEDGKYSTVVAKFINLSKRGLPLTVNSPGTQRRNFTHVDDIVSGLLLVGAQGFGDGYAIGSEISYSINELATMFNKEIIIQPKKLGNRLSSDLDTSKIKELGWKPQWLLSDYIREKIK